LFCGCRLIRAAYIFPKMLRQFAGCTDQSAVSGFQGTRLKLPRSKLKSRMPNPRNTKPSILDRSSLSRRSCSVFGVCTPSTFSTQFRSTRRAQRAAVRIGVHQEVAFWEAYCNWQQDDRVLAHIVAVVTQWLTTMQQRTRSLWMS
jgi:hypothetical protein